MAIELSIKIETPVDAEALKARVEQLGNAAASDWSLLSWAPANWSADGPLGIHSAATITREECGIELRVDGVESGLRDAEDGIWATLTVVLRSDESISVMMLVAVALAELARSPIVDESRLVGLGRVVAASVARRSLIRERPRALADIAQRSHTTGS
jgi:hypothetical protein